MEHLPPHLENNLSQFLPQLRLGIDIGEWAGGIAVVRGNEILHAETYTDYHGTTLENRRRLRRGRRTRHAKKMRLARLRSWALRQGLPDLYQVMRQHKFQCQPGEFNVGRKKLKITTGKKKDELGSWVEAVQSGVRNGPDEFLIALIQLFQKRGFQWAGSDLQEMTDDELAEELDETEGVRITPAVADQIKTEVRRRAANPQPEYEGKIKDLEKLLQAALGRKHKPRTAEHRSIIEDDLRRLVEAYTSRRCPHNTVAWTKALVRLLNKRVRKLRFENRVLSGCSWCGKNTPKKSGPQVRQLAYCAAVANLRADAANSRRMLSDTERKYFYDLWDRRKSEKPPTPETLKKKLLALRSQTEMARQLWELLASPVPPGRTNLCLQHLKMQADGAFLCSGHHAICRQSPDDFGKHVLLERVKIVGPAVRGAPNPCREAHDQRVIQRIKHIFFKNNGAPRFDGVPALITVEFPKPNTAQTYNCPSCTEKLAIDLRVRYRLQGIQVEKVEPREDAFKFTCPCCEALVQVKAKRQLTIRGERRRIPITLKNTDAFLRKAKGGLKDKKIRTYLAETRNTCVYCGTGIDRSTIQIDHIFPEADSGPGIDSNLVACCRNCNHPQTGKGKRTPWRWKGKTDGQWWQEFEKRVRKLPLPVRKQRILLSTDDIYPENPTALARAGSRPRAFIEELKTMLGQHGVRGDQIAENYEEGKIVIQAIDGWMTSQLRSSWLENGDGTSNFPEKNSWDLHNHAQDAVLISACPPHTWRERIFVFGKYNNHAPKELAPNWSAFLASHQGKKPLVTVLGNYDVSWRAQFANTEFWRDPLGWRKLLDKVEGPIDWRRLKRLKVKDAEKINDLHVREEFLLVSKQFGTNDNEILSREAFESLRERFKARPIKGVLLKDLTAEQGKNIKSRALRLMFRAMCKKHLVKKDSTLAAEGLAELQARLKAKGLLDNKSDKEMLRVQCYSQKGGKPFVVHPSDGSPRATEAKPAAEGVVIWLKHGKHLKEASTEDIVFSLVRPSPLRQFDINKEDPKLEQGSQRLKAWKRHAFEYLQKNEKHPEGWYRMKEFYEDKIIALPEQAIPADLADRMRLKKDGQETKVPSKERELRKTELLQYFKQGLFSAASSVGSPSTSVNFNGGKHDDPGASS